MSLPRVLIIDDQLGGAYGAPRNRLREELCLNIGIQDVTGDVKTDSIDSPIAEVVFCGGQVVENNVVYNDLEGTLKTIRRGWQKRPRWALILLDMEFRTGPIESKGNPIGRLQDKTPDKYFGLTILEHIWADAELSDIPVVILSSMPRDEIERRFADHGVFDFIDKPRLTRDRFNKLLMDYGLLESDLMVGRSLAFLKCLREARRRARMGNNNILILGETGTGKELLAKYIHDNSPRHSCPYVTVYTQGVPDNLVDDLIFGHEKGAFTGASAAQAGAAEQAHKGTLFIDEFGDLSPLVQSKLMRLLHEDIRETQRIGATASRKMDLLVILATNRMDLNTANGLRSDLLHRANISNPLVLPPLRERPEDIFLLVEFFVRRFEKAMGAEKHKVSAETLALFENYHWPGNVNQLKSIVTGAVSKYPGLRILSPNHIELQEKAPERPPATTELKTGSAIEADIPLGLSECCAIMDQIEFPLDLQRRQEWAGQFPHLRRTIARMTGKMLKAALEATADSSGELKIHPAVKLLMGDTSLSASQAADEIKRVVSKDASVHQEFESDPILSKAYAIALRLRPKGGRYKKHNKREDLDRW